MVDFSKFLQKGGGFHIYLIKREGLLKRGVVLKKGVSLIFILTNCWQCYLSLSVWCECVCLVYLHHFCQYLCVSWEELSLIESNQQIYDCNKWVILKSKDIVESKFSIPTNLFNIVQIAAVSTQQVVLIYIYMVVSVY